MLHAADDELRSRCPISMSLEIFGDRWTLLVVRDLLYNGRRNFGDFLGAEERIATNILAERLKRLEAKQIVERAADPADGRRSTYFLTEKGFRLAPVIVEIVLWAAAHEDTAAPPPVVAAIAADRDAYIAGLKEIWTQARAATAA